MKTFIITALLSMALIGSTPSVAATLKLVNGDGPGEGFNDTTPVAPIGGNKGKTLGEQRRLAFEYAAKLWGDTLPANNRFQIRVFAQFNPLFCTANNATLGFAGPIDVAKDFPGAPEANTWYPISLASKLAGYDLLPGPKVVPGVDINSINARMFDDIRAVFNSNLDTPPGCVGRAGWYYGFDLNQGFSRFNLITTLLHEFAHGLGFVNFTNRTNGNELLGSPDIFEKNIFDNTLQKHWHEMTSQQRIASTTNFRNVVWSGQQVTDAVPLVLQAGSPMLKVNAPPSIAGNYQVGTASFGPPVNTVGVTGDLVLAADNIVPLNDGCSVITNGQLLGKVALIDRGLCGFILKVKNAQNAGAIGVVIANNQATGALNIGGTDPTITIPSVFISQADGNTIKSALGVGVNVTLWLDPGRFAGTDALGRALLYTPNPVAPGSSVNHWDALMFPDQMMEPFDTPFITFDLVPPRDLSFSLMQDIGW